MNYKLKYCEVELEEIRKKLQTLPDGYLVKKRDFHYHAVNDQEIGITKKPEFIRLLRRKRYLLAREKQLINKVATISQYINNLETATPEEMIRSFPSAYQGSVTDFFLPSIAEWTAEDYEKNPNPPKVEHGYRSEKGMLFRSKSEYIIACILNSYNIPYWYDAAFTLGMKIKYADFIIKNPYNGKIFIWEHFGALHIHGYVQDMNEKMSLYIKHGYIPFENLIYTFEADVMDYNRLKYLIENIILF